MFVMSPAEKVDAKLQGVLPRRKNRQGGKASVNSISVMTKDDLAKWWFPKNPDKFTSDEKKMILGCIVEQMVKEVFNSHFYYWNGDIYHQEGGAPMGLRSACPISRAMMDHWVSKVLSTAEQNNALHQLQPSKYPSIQIHNLSKYVDDVLTLMQKFRKGTKWDSQNRVFITPDASEDLSLMETDAETMEQFSRMATDMVECLKFTWDCPSVNEGGAMPVLDTEMWIGECSEEWGVPKAILEDETKLPTTQKVKVCLYRFYRKSMANQTPIHSRSAQPEKDKIMTVTNEFHRRYRNNSRDLPTSEIEGVIKRYVKDLKRGGFSEVWI